VVQHLDVADEHQPGPLQGVRETGVLREESVTGMHGLGSGAQCGIDDRVDVQVALPGRRWADPHRDVGVGDVPGSRVGVTEHRNRADPHGTAGPNDAHGDLAAVGDQDGVESLCVHRYIRKTP